MKQFLNIGNKLRIDRGEDNALSSFPAQIETYYNSSKAFKDIHNDIHKKMASNCVYNYSTTEEKKGKKNGFEIMLSTLQEAEKKIPDDPITKDVMTFSSKGLEELSKATKEFDINLSTNVIKYFQEFYEDTSLSNLKKSLVQINREMKSREDKLLAIQDQIHSASNAANTSFSGEISEKLAAAIAAEENSEKELESKREIQRSKEDLFLTKLFSQDAQRVNLNEKLLKFFETYLEYFIICQSILTTMIPNIKRSIEKSKSNFVFDLPLEDHIKSTDGKLSFILETCISELDTEDTLKEEGLFRISGSKGKVDLLKSALNIQYNKPHIHKGCDVAAYASLLKQYLRELPEPLMTSKLYEKWCELGAKYRQSGGQNLEEIRNSTREYLSQIPKSHYDNLVYLMQFLRKIADNESYNKMSASNLGLVLGPNLVRPVTKKMDNASMSEIMSDSSRNLSMVASCGNNLIEYMIVDFHNIFPDAPIYKTKPTESSTTSERAYSLTPDGNNSNEHLNIDEYIGSVQTREADFKKDPNLRASYLRKAPAPPPPPISSTSTGPTTSGVGGTTTGLALARSYQEDIPEEKSNTNNTTSQVITRPSTQPPQIKKRNSRYPVRDDNSGSVSELATNVNVGRAVSTYIPRQNPPVLPSKKPQYDLNTQTTNPSVTPSASAPPKKPQLDSTTTSNNASSAPPKRPVYPPPPIPQDRKRDSIEENNAASTATTTANTNPTTRKQTHQYSKSDVSML